MNQTDLIEQQREKIEQLDREWLIFSEAIQHMVYSSHWPLDRRPDCPSCITVETARGLASSRTLGPDDEPEDA